MPDQTELLLQEVAVLRRELAGVLAALEKTQQSFRRDAALILERLEALTTLVNAMEARLPPLVQ